MVQDRLTEAVVSRLKELGLPPSLIELDGFRDHFLFHRWVMFVRDGDKNVNVHLVKPQDGNSTPRRDTVRMSRQSRKR